MQKRGISCDGNEYCLNESEDWECILIRLRARIREKLGSDVVFAARLGISKTSLSLRLNNQLHFSQRDIYNSMRILQIRPDEVGAYFFERPRCEEFYF